ncbi:hypothetical protein ANN_00907 [Periplaneta americana]|uniref:Uncharacterized protein n=1 Tax=Periplaneta americana TaxID=6978 RepID=A0ABQ8TUZ7_PERAM|nr:hypothetical protein ANN_00907 [Periplaneta americana]
MGNDVALAIDNPLILKEERYKVPFEVTYAYFPDRLNEMKVVMLVKRSPGSNTESYPAFAHIGLKENPGKNLNQVTCPNWESNPGHLVSWPDALAVTPQVWTTKHSIDFQALSPFSTCRAWDTGRRAVRRPHLTMEHAMDCLTYATLRQDFERRNVIFSDEVIVSSSNDGPDLVYRMDGHRCD